jgi:MSHA biogenesis protein MshJ
VSGRLLRFRDFVEAQTLRERIMALVGSIVVVGLLWHTLLISPLDGYRAHSKGEIRSLEKQLQAIKSETENLGEKLSIDPNEQGRIRKANRERELQRVDEDLRERVQNLIPPSQMVLVLREILVRQRKLQLVELKSLSAEPVLSESIDDLVLSEESGEVFRHTFQMELRGSYLSTLRYLEELEDLPWRFFWKHLSYEVLEYPEARVVLTVETLSLREGWIGV